MGLDVNEVWMVSNESFSDHLRIVSVLGVLEISYKSSGESFDPNKSTSAQTPVMYQNNRGTRQRTQRLQDHRH